MSKPTFFLSHSSEDKATIKVIGNRLGEENCWIDEGEIKLVLCP